MYPNYDTPRLTGPYADVHTARTAQAARLGTEAEDHTISEWVTVLAEGLGRVAETTLASVRDGSGQTETVRAELVELVASGVAMLERLDAGTLTR